MPSASPGGGDGGSGGGGGGGGGAEGVHGSRAASYESPGWMVGHEVKYSVDARAAISLQSLYGHDLNSSSATRGGY